MGLFSKRSVPRGTMVGMWLSGSNDLPVGYHRLLDEPDVQTCINWIAGIVGSTPIRVLRNTDKGDVRVHNRFSRALDIDPMPGIGTRFGMSSWIAATLLGEGNGNAYVLPHFMGGEITSYELMPGATSSQDDSGGYFIQWRSQYYDPTEVLHYRLFLDPLNPWKGKGIRVQAEQLAESLFSSASVKQNLSSPKYKPPIVVAVNSDSSLDNAEERENFRKTYLEDSGDGKPWILPADLVKIQQVKPLSLNDLAIKDNMELDRKAVCALIGVPGYVLGVGAYSEGEYNNTIRTRVIPIVTGMEQEDTLKLLADHPDMYVQLSRRHLYDYDLQKLIAIDCSMADRGYLNGDEVREDAYRDPAGLTEFKVLENYIPYDMSGQQSKLKED